MSTLIAVRESTVGLGVSLEARSSCSDIGGFPPLPQFSNLFQPNLLPGRLVGMFTALLMIT